MKAPRAAIFGVAGPTPTDEERRFFASADPLGFIINRRNAENPAQLKALTGELKDLVGRESAPILVDQEGGRVARLGPPHWRQPPSAATFGGLAARDLAAAGSAARLNARLIAAELLDAGITVDCAPVLDIPAPGSHVVVGDRAHGATPELVATLGRAVCEGLLEGGVMPIIKHIPGHGRSTVDSHRELPVVRESEAELKRTDFAPFRMLNDMPWAMTAHIVYAAIDDKAPATTSRAVIERVIRGHIGFQGLLVTDDLNMQALKGSLAERTAASLAAGCDVVLHCSGILDEMREIAGTAQRMTDAALARLEHGEMLRRPPAALNRAGAVEHLAAMLAGGGTSLPGQPLRYA
ncbi:MAG: beta-N-acetylhexosaminidase [Rhodospirillales bacterium]